MSGERQTETHQAEDRAERHDLARLRAETGITPEQERDALRVEVARVRAENDRLKTWQKAYAKGRAGLVEQADQDFARAEAAEARVTELEAMLRACDEQVRVALMATETEIEAVRRAIVEEVDNHLAFNVAAYGKAWTGEGEDTEFIVGKAAEKAIEALDRVRADDAGGTEVVRLNRALDNMRAEYMANLNKAEARVAELEAERDHAVRQRDRRDELLRRSGTNEGAMRLMHRAERAERELDAVEAERDDWRRKCACAESRERAQTDLAQDRIDRAVAERTKEIADMVFEGRGLSGGATLIEVFDAIRREFPAPTRTQEASDE